MVMQGGRAHRAVWWRMGGALRDLAQREGSVVFGIERNEWRGEVNLQLNIRDARLDR